MKPCIKCGGLERYVGGKCKACSKASGALYAARNTAKIKEQKAKYQRLNKDRKLATQAAWRSKNKERKQAVDAAWFLANADREKARMQTWRAANQARIKQAGEAYRIAHLKERTIHQKNRHAKLKCGGSLSLDLAQRLFKLQKGQCPCCKQPLGGDYHLDHKMPLALGGTNTDDNMQLLRKKCNLQKRAKHPVDFMQSRGFLL